jgi:hypothetical protein
VGAEALRARGLGEGLDRGLAAFHVLPHSKFRTAFFHCGATIDSPQQHASLSIRDFMFGIEQNKTIAMKTLAHGRKPRRHVVFIFLVSRRKLNYFFRYPQRSSESSIETLHKCNSTFEFSKLSRI